MQEADTTPAYSRHGEWRCSLIPGVSGGEFWFAAGGLRRIFSYFNHKPARQRTRFDSVSNDLTFSTEKADAGGEGAAGPGFELEKRGRVDVVVDKEMVAPSGNVLEPSAQREIEAAERETALEE